MAKKGTKFSKYSHEFKLEAVRLYTEDHLSYKTIVEILGLKSRTQVANWVKKLSVNEPLTDQRRNPVLKRGREKKYFSSKEEELIYIKAERDYLKKLYQNLFGEVCLRKQSFR